MASLYLTEFQASGNAESGAQLQVGVQPAVAMQKITFTTSTQSAESGTAGPRAFSCLDKWVTETRDTED